MRKPKHPSRLACAIAQFLTHKRALAHRCRQESWLLSTLLHHVETGQYCDLNAKSFERWWAELRDCHPNTRDQRYQVVRRFCLDRRRSEPGCFVPYKTSTRQSAAALPALLLLLTPGQSFCGVYFIRSKEFAAVM